MEGGVTEMDTKAGPPTVMVVEEETDEAAAVMVAEPCPELVASP